MRERCGKLHASQHTPHNGKNIATLINDEIIDLGIRDKIFTITLDNASSNDVAIQRLKRFWQIKMIMQNYFTYVVVYIF